jgi:hypothetical protein
MSFIVAADLSKLVTELAMGKLLVASADELRRRRAADADAFRAAIDFFRLDACGKAGRGSAAAACPGPGSGLCNKQTCCGQ